MRTVDLVRKLVNQSYWWGAADVHRVHLLAQAWLSLSTVAVHAKRSTQGSQCGTAVLWNLALSVFCSTEIPFSCPVFFHIWFALMLHLAAFFLLARLHLLFSPLSFLNVVQWTNCSE